MMMTKEEAKAFASRWLPAWSGNKPQVLADFYSEDCLYIDAGIPNGARGKVALMAYFKKLLAQNPNWVWTQIEAIPMEGGFLNKWRAQIPVGGSLVGGSRIGETMVECIGVCLVQFDEAGKIKRYEVYFDRTELVNEIIKRQRDKHS